MKYITEQWRKYRSRYLDSFVFIHINKTGGSSIEKALNLPFEHKTAIQKIEEIGEASWKKRLSFAVVRNPWDKVVSHYHYRVQTNQTGMGDGHIDFVTWVKRAYGDRDSRYYDQPMMFMPQVDWISDKEGNILVREILRFESLAVEFNALTSRLSIKAKLPHVKKSGRKHVVGEYYDDVSRTIVAERFAEDIEAFNYRFPH